MFEMAIFIGKGLVITLILLIGSLIVGLCLGILMSVMRYNGVGTFVINRLISVLRGTPLILQLSLIYFCLPDLGIKLDIITAGIVAFGLNSSAYTAEILRSGIESIPKGQFEASRALKIPLIYMWKDVILPQVLRNICPALVGEVTSLLKETAIISILGCADITRRSQLIAAERFEYFIPLLIAGMYYYLLVLIIELIGRRLERNVNS